MSPPRSHPCRNTMHVALLLAVQTQRGFASYDLIDETPSCMNGNTYYCGTFCACGDNQTQMCADSRGGMKYLERAQLSFMNMALTSPDDFDAEYNGVWRSWTATCTMATRAPMWWDSGLSQAARWHSWEQAMTDGCYCTHDTCDGNEDYFGGFTDVGPRIQSFDVKGNLVFFGENVNSGYGQITRSLMIGWFQSAGHCANIFDDTWNVIGVGYYFGLANDIYSPNGHFWTENFGQVLNPPTHEIVSGSHIESEEDTSLLRFFATYYSATSTEPSSSVVYIDDVEYTLTLLTGTAAAGTYYVDVDKTDWTSCKAYYFKFGSTRLPESECYRYYTFSVGDCETDYEVTCTPESDDDDEYTCAETTSYYIHYSDGDNCSSASNATRTCENINSNSVCYTQVNELFSSTDWGSATLCSSARPVGCYVTNVDEEADTAKWYWNYGYNCEGTTNSQCSENYQCVCYCEEYNGGGGAAWEDASSNPTSTPRPSGEPTWYPSPAPSVTPEPTPTPLPSALPLPAPTNVPTPLPSPSPTTTSSPTSNCDVSTCYDYDCDYWVANGPSSGSTSGYDAYTCEIMESVFDCDCGGCDCATSVPSDCDDTCYGYDCDHWVAAGPSSSSSAGYDAYTCEIMESVFECDCGGCDCPAPTPEPTDAPPGTTPGPTFSPMPSASPVPRPSSTPTSVPTGTYTVPLSAGLAGITCDDYTSEEEAVVNAGLASVLGLTGDVQSMFGDHTCTDDSRRRSNRHLLSTSVSIGTSVTITSADDWDTATAAIGATLVAAASDNSLTSAIVSAATDAEVASMASVSVTIAASTATDSPTASPTPSPVDAPSPTVKPSFVDSDVLAAAHRGSSVFITSRIILGVASLFLIQRVLSPSA